MESNKTSFLEGLGLVAKVQVHDFAATPVLRCSELVEEQAEPLDLTVQKKTKKKSHSRKSKLEWIKYLYKEQLWRETQATRLSNRIFVKSTEISKLEAINNQSKREIANFMIVSDKYWAMMKAHCRNYY
ncbi:hypothetical protein TKK_0017792 [Trichogramma kaykai]|uniref:Uncharacterized protein n=1 Tax=Trichogramma kaykai TaxID=54128 RepID=A0ABD2W2I6_9HYME